MSAPASKLLGLLATECTGFEVGKYVVRRDNWGRWSVWWTGSHEHYDTLEDALKSAISRHKRETAAMLKEQDDG